MNFYLKLAKCEFHKEEIDFLNFIIRQNEVFINLNKIEIIKNQKTSTNIKEL